MTKTEALEIEREIKDVCEKHRLWNHKTYENRPKLGKIIIEIWIKVDSDD